jgi:hypothetical protein
LKERKKLSHAGPGLRLAQSRKDPHEQAYNFKKKLMVHPSLFEKKKKQMTHHWPS